VRRRVRHPKTTDRVRAVLAKASVPLLVGEFLLIVALVSLALAAAFELTDAGRAAPSFLEWWKQVALAVLSFPTDLMLAPNVDAERSALQLLTAAAGIVLPALFVAALVLKLFISPRLFVMRDKLVVMETEANDPRKQLGDHHLALRGYSSTRFELLNVTFTVLIRCERVESNGTKTLVHRELRVANPRYAVARSHVPYTVALPIEDGDWSDEKGGELARLQGFALGPQTELILLVEGSIPELSTDFTEAHAFRLPDDLSAVPFAGIVVDESRRSRRWTGWSAFDES
jgi:hypothetical protein